MCSSGVVGKIIINLVLSIDANKESESEDEAQVCGARGRIHCEALNP